MDRIPLYARGGAVIPMWTDAPASTDGYHPRAVELHVFVPRTDGDFTFPMEFAPTPDGGWLLTRDSADMLLEVNVGQSPPR